MADHRYQDRPFPADDDYSHAPDPSRSRSEADPLAELARLIGQSDPFASRSNPRRAEPAAPEADEDTDVAPVGPPPWMKRVAAQEAYQHESTDRADLGTVHPVNRYAAQPEPEPEYHPAPSFAAHADPYADSRQEPVDPARYDDALYGQPDPGFEQPQDQNYQDDAYGYQDGYADESEPKRRSGLVTVAVVLALAVVGTGAAFAYRTYIGSPRSGEPPVIKADTGPNKVVPPSSNDAANAKLIQDRLAAAPEKVVSREETPVNVQDATKAGGPRVVFPPLNQNANPPSTASVSPANKPMVGTPSMQGDEPRKIRTFTVKGDQADANATPAARQTPTRLTGAPPAARPAANAPISLSPQAAPAPASAPAAAAPARVANNAPQQIAPAPATAASGGYVVQISSQRTEAEAAASFRALQGKFPGVLGSRSPLIKRADLGDKGVYYRAMVGPFGSTEEAAQLCGSLKSAGGQCVVQRN